MMFLQGFACKKTSELNYPYFFLSIHHELLLQLLGRLPMPTSMKQAGTLHPVFPLAQGGSHCPLWLHTIHALVIPNTFFYRSK